MKGESDFNRERARAHHMLRKTYPVRQKCSVKDCNKLGERHIIDSRNPLKIAWLCRKHHMLWHRSGQTIGEIEGFGEFTLEEFCEGKSREEWFRKRCE